MRIYSNLFEQFVINSTFEYIFEKVSIKKRLITIGFPSTLIIKIKHFMQWKKLSFSRKLFRVQVQKGTDIPQRNVCILHIEIFNLKQFFPLIIIHNGAALNREIVSNTESKKYKHVFIAYAIIQSDTKNRYSFINCRVISKNCRGFPRRAILPITIVFFLMIIAKDRSFI